MSEKVAITRPLKMVEHISIEMDLVRNFQLQEDLIEVFQKHHIAERDGEEILEAMTNISICNNIRSGNCKITYHN